MKKLFSLLILSTIFLTACGSSKWTIDMGITPEEQATFEQVIVLNNEAIRNYEPEGPASNPTPPINLYLEKGMALLNLGRMKESLAAYKEASELFPSSVVLINNMGYIYERVGEYEKSAELYKQVVDRFGDTDYLYKITWSYIRGKNRKEAEKYFNAWQLATQKTDNETQQAIKRLREEEKGKSK